MKGCRDIIANFQLTRSVHGRIRSPVSNLLPKLAGGESLEDWIDHPSYPNTTLSWNIIYGKFY